MGHSLLYSGLLLELKQIVISDDIALENAVVGTVASGFGDKMCAVIVFSAELRTYKPRWPF